MSAHGSHFSPLLEILTGPTKNGSALELNCCHQSQSCPGDRAVLEIGCSPSRSLFCDRSIFEPKTLCLPQPMLFDLVHNLGGEKNPPEGQTSGAPSCESRAPARLSGAKSRP